MRAFGQGVPELPGAVGAVHCGGDAGEGFGGTGVGAERGARGHGANCEENYVGGFDANDAWGAFFVEVDLLDCDFGGFCKGEPGHFCICTMLATRLTVRKELGLTVSKLDTLGL